MSMLQVQDSLRAAEAQLMSMTKRLPPWARLAAAAGGATLAACVLAALYHFSRRARGGARTVAAGAAGSTDSGSAPLDEFEKQLVRDFVDGATVATSFDDVGGLRAQIEEIQELVIFPLTHAHLFAHSKLAEVPTGLLLYGPPGTGKTMLAKAIARCAQSSFLHVNVAQLESKWFGETPKRVQALFSLARRRAPCVMFVDEMDGLLSARNEADVAHVNTMKTVFMEAWDGLRTPAGPGVGAKSSWVLVVGATNKPWALDPAVLRRMPRQVFVGLPDLDARVDIMRVLLRHEHADDSVASRLPEIAALTEGFSGSDLRELVRNASLVPIREACRKEMSAAAAPPRGDAAALVRALTMDDMHAAARSTKPTGTVARAYRAWQAEHHAAAFGGKDDSAASRSSAGADATLRTLLHMSPANSKGNSLAICAALQQTPTGAQSAAAAPTTGPKVHAARTPLVPHAVQNEATVGRDGV